MSGRSWAAAALTAVLAVGLVGFLVLSTPEARCEDFGPRAEYDEEGEVTAASVLLVDVADNSSDRADSVAGTFDPEIEAALAKGSRLVARASGGTGEPIRSSPCFEVGQLYLVERNNTEREDDDRAAGRELLVGEVRDLVATTEVAENGSAVALLVEAHDVVDDLLAEGVAAEEISVFLYSDLLAVSDDCLNLHGEAADAEVADRIADRCLESQQLTPLPPGVRLTIRGAGDRADSPAQTVLASHLRVALCDRLSTSCNT